MNHKPLSQRMVQALLILTVPALALSSIHTRFAGLAWLFISLAGVVAWLGRKHGQDTSSTLQPVLPAARWWLIACLAAFVLMALPTAYWGGPWQERHPQWRLMIGALGLWCLLRYSAASLRTVQALATAAAVACLLAYGLVITSGSSAAPTNRIPWMAGLALLSCALLSLSYSLQNAPIRLRYFWLAASAVMPVTALISGVRGSWPLLLVWPLLLWRLHGSAPLIWGRAWKWILPMLAVLLAVGLHFIPEGDNPMIRITAFLRETAITTHAAPVSRDTSNGVRVALYKLGITHVLDQPWLGLGPAKTKQLIRGELENIGAHNQLLIGHMHSDLLHPWMEFGLFGLAGYLAYAVGLAVAAWHLSRSKACASMSCGLMALLAMHLSTGQTSMNFSHNYYPVMLALSTALVMMGCQHHAAKTPSSS
jgi:O-antigen ligase